MVWQSKMICLSKYPPDFEFYGFKSTDDEIIRKVHVAFCFYRSYCNCDVIVSPPGRVHTLPRYLGMKSDARLSIAII